MSLSILPPNQISNSKRSRSSTCLCRFSTCGQHQRLCIGQMEKGSKSNDLQETGRLSNQQAACHPLVRSGLVQLCDRPSLRATSPLRGVNNKTLHPSQWALPGRQCADVVLLRELTLRMAKMLKISLGGFKNDAASQPVTTTLL
jgi:hypothetical protein